MADETPRLFKISSVAKRWDMSKKTIGRMIHANKLQAVRTDTGQLRITVEEVERYERSLPAA